MFISYPTRLAALLLLALMIGAVAACGGGDESTVPSVDYEINAGNNNVPPLVIDGPSQYSGKQDEPQPTLPETNEPVVIPKEAPFVYGQNIFAVPLDTNGVGHVIASDFSPGQRIALLVVNLNPAYRDAHYLESLGRFPPLPDSRFTVRANQIDKGTASTPSLDEMLSASAETLGPLGSYSGMDYSSETVSPYAIYEREALARGITPYAPIAPAKTTSYIQKGEIRAFIYVPPRPAWPPKPVPPDPENPDEDTSNLQYPPGYNCQYGRLTTIGAHCNIFLTTDINFGHPDNIQYTEARLNQMAREFDTKIFPIATSSFGEVVSYGEEGIMRDVELYLQPPITAADYDNNGQFMRDVPGEVDTALESEERINIFIFNGDDGGFYVGAPLEGENEYGEPHATGSTLYIGSDNFPANDDAWSAAFSIMAHEFQHKLYSDHGMPTRTVDPFGGNYNWLNEGLSQLDIHLCGYTVNSGRIVPWAIDGQLTDYLANVNLSAVCMDGNGQFPIAQQTQYGNGFLFFLYLYEHYNPGIAKRMYELGASGENDYIKLVEAGAQFTQVEPGPDGELGTVDDETVLFNDSFANLYTKFMIANFIDGIYKEEYADLFDPRFHYNTLDLRGTVNLSTGTIVLPGVRTDIFPKSGGYPVQSIDRKVIPWGCDYLVFSNGDGRDLEITIYSDPFFRMFLLPVTFNAATNKVEITEGITLNY